MLVCVVTRRSEGDGVPEAGYPPLRRVLVLRAEHEGGRAGVAQREHLVATQAVVRLGLLLKIKFIRSISEYGIQ